MLSNNMNFKELNGLNYRGVCVTIDADILVQCMPVEDRKRFVEDYANTIKNIFADCAGIDKLLPELIDIAKEFHFAQIVPNDENSKGYITYPSLIQGILAYVCQGKHYQESDISSISDGERPEKDTNSLVSDAYRNIIRKVRKELTDMQDSDDYDIGKLNADYPKLLIMVSNSLLSVRKDNKILVETEDGLEEAKQCLTQLIFANKNMFEVTTRYPIDFDKYSINRDKYLFYIFSNLLEGIVEWDNGQVNNNIYPILSYFKETVDKDIKDLFYYDMDKKTRRYTAKYTYNDFLKKLQEYVKKYREINCDILPFNYFEGWDPKEVDEFLDFFTEETLSNFKEIDPKVLFLPSGRGISEPIERGTSTEVKEKVFSLLPLEKREFYSKNRDKIHMSLLGEKKFKGYILNVLNNGYIIFEKYDTKEGDISNKNAAAYIMNIFNFKMLYEMSPSEIRKISKAQDKNKPLFDKIDYKCHMGKWQEYLQKFFDEDTGLNTNDVDEVLAMEKVKAVQYKKEKEEV